MKKLVEKYVEMPRAIRKPMWRFWHNLMNKFDKDKTNLFMNYGYASQNGQFKHLDLKPHDEPDRYFIQLYDHVTRNHNLENASVLEVGSGRGGGASFLTRYKRPKEYIGLDISQSTIDLCNKHHNVEGLNFVKGEAENLPFDDSSFDAVVNVESARAYENIPKFFGEVYRVLKQDGKFLFADMIKPHDVEGIRKMLADTGFAIEEETDIRENVVHALQKNTERNKSAINKSINKYMRGAFYEFAGVEGSNRYYEFYNAKMHYRSFTLRKNSVNH